MAYQTLPALIALVFKLALLAYALRSPRQNVTTRLFIALLALFSLHNLVEFVGLNHFATHGLDARMTMYGYSYFVVGILFIALVLHLSLRLSTDRWDSVGRYSMLLYAPVVVLEFLLLATNKLVAGFTTFSNYTILRVAGPLYFLFETFAVLYLLAALAYLVYGARRSRAPIINRTRNRLWLAALSPFVLLNGYVIVANHFGLAKLSSTVFVPIAITLFLAITTYATHQYRLFDIEFYIPWSKVRKRKTAFYDRIRAMVAEIADLGSGSISHAVNRLADTFRCPVALVDDSRAVLAAAGPSRITALPLNMLRNVDHIMVANEIADAKPEMYALMKQHGIGAIVPFHPHSQNAASWLLLGDSFSENVYTPLDFRMVEQLFDKMADLFLDKLVAMRMQLADAQRHISALETRLQAAESNMTLMQGHLQTLTQENTRLLREQPADSLINMSQRASAPFTLTLLGRDKDLLRMLRQRFTQAESYAGPESASFRRQPPPDVLVIKVDDGTGAFERRLLQIATHSHRGCAILLYGARAHGFGYDYRRELAGSLVEVLPQNVADDALLRKIGALAELRRALHGAADADHPLLGMCPTFKESITEAKRLAGLADPVCVKTADLDEAVALARYMHDLSGAKGRLEVLRTMHAETESNNGVGRIGQLLANARSGTFVIDDIGALPNELWEQLLVESSQFTSTRLIVGQRAGSPMDAAASLRPLHPFVLDMPDLRARRADIPLLVHYFTLHFNLQAGSQRYLAQADIDELTAAEYPKDLRALKAAVFARLVAKEKCEVAAAPVELNTSGRTLDECVAQFEAQLIVDTLKRCEGNKSKAARLLGMRPNTLHYKLERYGLLDK